MRADTVPSSSTWIAKDRLTPEDEGGLNVGALVKTLQRKWWIIAGMTVVSMGLATARVLTEKPIYSGDFEILVKAQSTETEVISNVPETITSQERDAVSRDLLKILTGPAVLQPVIEGIKEQYPNYCPSTPESAALTDPLEVSYDPCYQTLVSRLRVNQLGNGSDIIRVSLQDPDPQTVQVLLGLVSQAYLY